MSRKEELLALLLETLAKEEESPEEKAKAEAEAKAREEAEARARAEAEAKRRLEAEQKKQETPEPEQKEVSEEDERLKELERRAREQSQREVNLTLKSSLKDSNLDDDHFDSISEYLSYDKLVDENGEVDSEAVEKLTKSLASIALRTPPKAKRGPKDLTSAGSGLSKYLPKD